MNNNIAYCGIDCSKCATRSEDTIIRQKQVDVLRKVFGSPESTTENVRCPGCKSEGLLPNSACQARPCAIEKGLDSCAECDEFPCRKVAHLIANRDAMVLYGNTRLKELDEAEFELAIAPFSCSLDNLLQVLREKGKLPDWCK